MLFVHMSYDSCRLVTTFALLSLKSQQFAHFYKITIFSIQTHTSFQSFHRHERSRRLQRATNLTSFSRAHDMCGHVRAACARRCSKEFHVICRVRGGLIDILFSNASSYHVRLDKNVATPHVCTCRVCISKPNSLRNVHMGFAELEED